MPQLPDVPGPEVAPRLRDAFLAAGYTAEGVATLLGSVAQRALARGEPAPARRATGGGSALETLVRLFLLGRPVAEQAARAALGGVPGMTEPAGEGTVRAAFDLRPYGDGWFVASDARPVGSEPGPAMQPETVVGIGAASLTLVTATPRLPVPTALDLGTGCGVQALHLSQHVQRVTATDINPRALALARLTAALSGVDLELSSGDLYHPVADRRFDLIVGNPPFVIGPNRFSYRDSELPADGLSAQVVHGAAPHLVPGGVAVLLGSWLHRRGEDWRDRVASWLPPGCDALVLQREVLDPAEHVTLWLDDGDEDVLNDEGLVDAWLDDLEQQHAHAVGYGLVVLRRTDADPRTSLLDLFAEPAMPDGQRVAGWLQRVQALRGREQHALRLERAPDLRLTREFTAEPDGWEPAGLHLRAASAIPQTVDVDDVLAALVNECDPALPLGATLDLLAAGTGDPDLPARALPAVLALAEAGFLVPR